MKKTTYLFLTSIVILAFACSSDDNYQGYSYNESTIYSESNTTQFTEVIAFISPYILSNGEKKYVVVDN